MTSVANVNGEDAELIAKKEVWRSLENEFEIWKRQETEKHERQMKAMELERMEQLEAEWRKHEQQRDKDIKELKTHLHSQTEKAMYCRSL